MIIAAILTGLVMVTGCGGGRGGGNPAVAVLQACNGSPRLCDKRLTEITLLGTHNSYSNAAEGWQLPNQGFGITRQLKDGVRALVLDVWDENGVAALCHTYCHLGRESLASGFTKIVDFLKANPNEVITIGFENYISGPMMEAVAKETGLLNYIHVLEEGKPWPTLRQMIFSGKRVVMFTDREGGAFPGFHATKPFIEFNGWGYTTADNQDCDHKDGSVSNPTATMLYSLNHQYVNAFGIPTEANAAVSNTRAAILKHVKRCEAEKNHRINIVELDFYNIGDGMAVVNEMNGVTNPRKGKPSATH